MDPKLDPARSGAEPSSSQPASDSASHLPPRDPSPSEWRPPPLEKKPESLSAATGGAKTVERSWRPPSRSHAAAVGETDLASDASIDRAGGSGSWAWDLKSIRRASQQLAVVRAIPKRARSSALALVAAAALCVAAWLTPTDVWGEIVARQPSGEWARTAAAAEAQSRAPASAAFDYRIDHVTVARLERGVAVVTAKGTAVTRDPLYAPATLQEGLAAAGVEAADLTPAKQMQRGLPVAAADALARAEPQPPVWIKQTVESGEAVPIEFEFEAHRDGLQWQAAPKTALVRNDFGGGPRADFPGAPEPIGSEAARQQAVDYAQRTQNFLALASKAQRDARVPTARVEPQLQSTSAPKYRPLQNVAEVPDVPAAAGQRAEGGFRPTPVQSFSEVQESESAETAAAGSAPLPGERFTDTRSRILEKEEVKGWTDAKIRYALNEMFARHGADFADPSLSKWFRQFAWYQPRPDLTFDSIESQMSPTEQQNVKLLASVRDARKLGAGAQPARNSRTSASQRARSGDSTRAAPPLPPLPPLLQAIASTLDEMSKRNANSQKNQQRNRSSKKRTTR